MSIAVNDREAFVNAIHDSPRDDAPRLAYADWLEGHGKPEQAVFVRLQCRAARLPIGSVERADAIHAAEELAAEHENDWLGKLAGRLVTWDYRRGFLHSIRMNFEDFLEHGEELLRFVPVQKLELVKPPVDLKIHFGDPLEVDEIKAVVSHPAFAHVREIAVVKQLHSEDVKTWLACLAAATHVTKLRAFGPVGEFDLYNQFSDKFGLPRSVVAKFCAAPHLRSLRSLDLGNCPLRKVPDKDLLAKSIAGATFARNLRRLNLSSCRLTSAGIKWFANCKELRRLVHLNLTDNLADVEAWSALFHSPNLKRVRSIALNAGLLSAFAASPMAGQIQRLAVRWADRDDTGEEMEDPVDVPGWAEIISAVPPPKRLTLRNHNPGEATFQLMQQTGWLRRLRELNLSSDSQGGAYRKSDGFLGLFQPGVMPRLTRLRLHQMDDKALGAIAAWPGLSQLESLDLEGDYYGQFKPSSFPSEHSLAQLRTLKGVTISTDEDIDRFLALPGLENLATLTVSFLGHYDTKTSSFTDDEFLTKLAVERLFRSDRLARLKELLVSFISNPRYDVTPMFADTAVLPRLQILYLNHCFVGASTDDLPDISGVQTRFGLRLVAFGPAFGYG